MLIKAFGAQLREPHGLCAGVMGLFMNRLNRSMIEQTLELLAPQPDERIMDIGFGGGHSLQRLLKCSAGIKVTGIEPSSAMLSRAQRRFSAAVEAGTLTLAAGAAECLPVPSQSIDAVCSVNTIYFWPDLTRGFAEIARTLRAHGRLAIGYRPAEVMQRLAFTRHGFTLYDERELSEALARAGMRVVRSTRARGEHAHHCLLARTSTT